MLSIRNTTYSYGAAGDWMLSIDSFVLSAGDVVVIDGDNMSGKSTFAKLLAGLLPFQLGSNVVFHNRQGPTVRKSLRSKAVLLSSDDPMFPDLTCQQNIALSLNSGAQKKEGIWLTSAKDVFRESGILSADDLSRDLSIFSSGGRAIVKLCRVLDESAEILLVDEVSAFLDAQRSAFFLDTLLSFRTKGKAIVLISHNERDKKYVRSKGAVRDFYIRREAQSSILEEEK